MKKQLIFLFLLTSMGCFGQFTKLTVSFSPSFIDKSQVLIEKNNDSYSLSISNSTINEKRVITESSMAELQQLFANYAITKRTEDSLETVRVKKVMEENEKYAKESGVPALSAHEITTDGMCVSIEVVDKKGTTSLFTCNPKRGTINYRLTSALFALMRSTFQKPETITYLYELGSYL